MLLPVSCKYETVSEPNVAYVAHDSIEILSNDDLAAFCSIGDGTAGNPYIIENFLIQGNTTGIKIFNTNAHVCIRNNMIVDQYTGIDIFNAQNVNISFNILSNNNKGIEISNSLNVLAFGNTIADCNVGIDLNSVVNGRMISNTIRRIEYSGLEMKWTNSSIVNSNNLEDCYNGIALYYGNQEDNIFMGNSFTRCGFYMDYADNFTIDTTNKVNGKSVRYYEQKIGVELINESDIGQLILVSTNNSRFVNLNVSSSNIGVLLVNSNNNKLEQITANFCQIGISFTASKNNSISRSQFNFNRAGIYLYCAIENRIAGNMIKNNTYIGIYFDNSGFNTIYYNAFINNTEHISVVSSNNYWDNGQKGNFWDNYLVKYPSATHNGKVWNTPYNVIGLEQDKFPLIYVPFSQFDTPSLTNPSNSTNGTIFIQWNSIVEADYYLVYRSNSTITQIQGLTPIANTTSMNFSETLANGTYYYVVVAVNEFLQSNVSNNVMLTVSIPPEKSEQPTQIIGYSLVIIGLVSVVTILSRIRRRNLK